MKYTLLVTQDCNLRCDYCYIGKSRRTMSLDMARRIVDLAYARTPDCEPIEIGFFGGEPLLQFPLVERIAGLVTSHPSYDPDRVLMSIVTNGTIFSAKIADFLKSQFVSLVVSCDGPPKIQDRHRRSAQGRGTSHLVAETLRAAVESGLPVRTNSVYDPDSIGSMTDVVSYLSSLGVRRIFLNPDFSAAWDPKSIALLPSVFERLAELYTGYYEADDPHFVSPIDFKIAVILRGGYQPLERCRMGTGEFAFTPAGGIYPCERLVGDGGTEHRIGEVRNGLTAAGLCPTSGPPGAVNSECASCAIRPYCMNWCGCSNYFSTGRYDLTGPFLCACERACLEISAKVLARLERRLGPTFADHAAGLPSANTFSTSEYWRRFGPGSGSQQARPMANA